LILIIFRKKEREAINKEPPEAPSTLQDGIAVPSADAQPDLQEYLNNLEMRIEEWVDSWYKIDTWDHERGPRHASGHLIPMRRPDLRKVQRQGAELNEQVASVLQRLPDNSDDRAVYLNLVIDMTKRLACAGGILGVVLDNGMAEKGAAYNLRLV
jgi:hypothetical protein